MKRFISFFAQRRVYDKAYREALECGKKGHKSESFEMFNILLKEHPYDVNLRRQILLLGKDLGKDVHLPHENNTQKKQ